ncbi:MAG: hypothetical protein E7Z75_09790 [Methanobrevibacter olleyae]|uniref:Uncharacterized protein n=1 Tax=Methanobrevibacter olleyae TaxID=294671 RepID=A0A8T3VTP9_METOL|nr:hypothetical protein [Methanobrevibacter olleyae]
MVILTKENKYSWLRQNKEPESAYKWFTYFRDMKGTRRLKKVIEIMKEKEPYLERYPTYNEIKKASSLWTWKQRTIDYDNYLQIQLIESHKKTLIIYEEESINIDKKIFNALNTEIDTIIKNEELAPDKKIKALREAQKLNKSLLSDIEHIANIEVPEVKYLDVEATLEENIINSLIQDSKGYYRGNIEDVLEGYTPEEIKGIIRRYSAEKEANNNPLLSSMVKYDNITYDNENFNIPK